MFITLPFPPCPVCHSGAERTFHKNCGGLLEVDPYTYTVKCAKCGHTWPIKKSRYYCTCGYSFEADEIKKKLNTILELCRIYAKEYELELEAKRFREKESKASLEDFISGVLKGLSIISGVVVESIIQFIVKLWIK